MNIDRLLDSLEKRWGSSSVVLLVWVGVLLVVGVAVGAASTLLMLGLWPFHKLSEWLLG